MLCDNTSKCDVKSRKPPEHVHAENGRYSKEGDVLYPAVKRVNLKILAYSSILEMEMREN